VVYPQVIRTYERRRYYKQARIYDGTLLKVCPPGICKGDATKNPTYNVYLSAYKNKKDNSVVAVVINKSTEAKTIIYPFREQVSESGKDMYYRVKNLRKESDINASGTTFQVTLEPQSVTTFVAVDPVNRKYRLKEMLSQR